jgi:hypothetical protein
LPRQRRPPQHDLQVPPRNQLNFQVLNLLQNRQVQYTTVPGVTEYLPTNVLQLERRWLLGIRLSY